MNFSEALELLKDGQEMRRPVWVENSFVKLMPGVMHAGTTTAPQLQYTQGDLTTGPWSARSVDMLATDWVSISGMEIALDDLGSNIRGTRV